MTKHIDHAEKANRIFAALSTVPQPQLSLQELADATDLTAGQAYHGWRYLRSILGEHVAVMTPRGSNTVYFLSDDFQLGAEYLYWQARNIYTRVNSARASLRDLQRAAADTMPAVLGSLEDTADNFSGVRSNLRQTIRFLGAQIGISEEELARVLAA
jgi:hypothetical protein